MQDINFLNNVNIDGDEVVRGNERVDGWLHVANNIELSGSILSGGVEISTLWSMGGPVDVPVTSVNGLTGDVVINAGSVSALPLSGGTIFGNLSVLGTTNLGSVNALSSVNIGHNLNVTGNGNFTGNINTVGNVTVLGSLTASNLIYNTTRDYVIATPGDDLAIKYAIAKTLTPAGSALAANNRSALLIMPGYYTLSTTLSVDGEFVDVVGIGASNGHAQVFVVDNTLNVAANDVRVCGIDVRPLAFQTNSNKNLQIIDNCLGGNYSFCYGASSVAAGTYTNCVAGDYSFGSGGVAKGSFKDCKGGVASFGGGISGSSGYCKGKFTSCEGDLNSFGSLSSDIFGGKLYSCKLNAGKFASAYTLQVAISSDNMNPTVFTSTTNHDFSVDEGVTLFTTGNLPQGIDSFQQYYISADNFSLTSFSIKSQPGVYASIVGGAAQNGIHSVTSARLINCVDGYDDLINV